MTVTACVLTDVHRKHWVCEHIDLNHPVPLVLDVKIKVGKQVVVVLRLDSPGGDLVDLQFVGAHGVTYVRARKFG